MIICSLKVAQNSFLIFFSTNSFVDRNYHTFSFVSSKMESHKFQIIIAQQVVIIFLKKNYRSNTRVS